MRTILLCMFFMNAGYSQLAFEDWSQPEVITEARALSMGNSYVSKVDDEFSAFYNPAGLGTVKHASLRLFNLHFETNKNMMDLAMSGNVFDKIKDADDNFTDDGMRALLVNNRGNLLHSRFNFFPNFTMRHLTIGWFYSRQMRAFVPTDPAASLELGDRYDYGPILSTNISIWGGVLKIGGSVMHLHRREYLEHNIDITQELNIESDDYKRGSATIITAGAKLTAPIAWLPTFSWVLRNTSQQDFSDVSGAGKPEPYRQTTDLGFSVTPIFGKGFRFHIEANVKDIGNKHDKLIERRSMVGMEFDFSHKFFVRLGYGDGFGSGGIGFRTKRFSFDFITYATEATPNGFRTLEDRRYAFSISTGL